MKLGYKRYLNPNPKKVLQAAYKTIFIHKTCGLGVTHLTCRSGSWLPASTLSGIHTREIELVDLAQIATIH